MISDLIKKGMLTRGATLATTATHTMMPKKTVADVATVAVATSIEPLSQTTSFVIANRDDMNDFFKNMENETDVTLKELKELANEDWDSIKDNQEVCTCLAQCIADDKLMSHGIVPSTYTIMVNCVACGMVPTPIHKSWEGRTVLGCSWCHHSTKPSLKKTGN